MYPPLTVLAFRPFVSNRQWFSCHFHFLYHRLILLFASCCAGVGHDDESAGWTLFGAVRSKHLRSWVWCCGIASVRVWQSWNNERSLPNKAVGFEGKQVQVCGPGNVQLSEYERLWQLVDNKSNG
jgi:hypothetical protein